MAKQSGHSGHSLARVFTAGSFSAIVCFAAQRVVTWKALGLETLPSTALRLQAQITGLLADVWAGVIVATLILGIVAAVPAFRRNAVIFYPMLMTFAIAFLCLHVPYVEYFGAMISLTHFKYLLDPDFVKTGTANVTDGRLWIITLSCAALMPLGLFLLRKNQRPLLTAVAVFLVGVFSQVTKVQLNTKKVGWKTPKILSVSSIEYVFVQLMESKSLKPDAVTDQEFALLRTYRSSTSFSLKNILEENARGVESHLGQVLKNKIQARVAANQPVTLFVALLESVRPEESRFFTPTNPVTYTPFLDELASTSLAFTQAYTAGGVTRSGQESSLCGLLTGEFTSAMRNLLSLNPQCLAQHLKNKFGPRAWSAWWHAGDFNFDSQGTFWRRHGVDFTTSRKDFAPKTPKTFWGISDFSLVEKIKNEILQRTPSDALVASHVFLSVTNHPDWGLPRDTPAEMIQSETNIPHISVLTTRYTDEALRRLVEVLKTTSCAGCPAGESIWDSSLFIVTNDHGNLLPSQNESQGHTFGISDALDVSAANAVSRAALVVSGGLLQNSLSSLNETNVVVANRVVSQVDIFATLATLFDLPVLTVGDSLFADERRWPVTVDLGNNVYFPELSRSPAKVFSRNDLLKTSPIPETSLSANRDTARHDFYLTKTFFRAYQTLLMNGEAGR